MTLSKRLFYLRRIFRTVPRLTRQVDSLESLVPKLVALGPVVEAIGSLDKRIAQLEVLEATVPRLQALDRALERIDRLGEREAEAKHEEPKPIKADHEANRLKMLSKFAALAGKADQIEKEWQRIQQDEHDAYFAFQVFKGNRDSDYAYKRGIAEGIKWCVSHFS